MREKGKDGRQKTGLAMSKMFGRCCFAL